MIQQLQQTAKRKQQLSNQLSLLKNDLLAKIFEGTIKKQNISKIHSDILKIAKASNIPLQYTRPLLNYAYKLTSKAKKEKEEDASLLALAVYSLFQKDESYLKFKTVTNEVIKDFEADEKNKIIEEELEYSRKLGNPKIFWLCSQHSDCALDHLDYQGKIYVDEKWESFVKNDKLKQIVKNYIATHNIKTFQWVTNRPVWLITRPNCRHYFKALTVNDVLNNSVNSLILSNKMTHTIGKRVTKTIAHDTRKQWYVKTNIENIIKKYKDRLDFHKKLYKVRKLDILKKAIEKDKFLIKKWENYLTSQQI